VVLSLLILLIPFRSHDMPWKAKPGCADHHKPAVERIVNKLLSAWLLLLESGEVFDSLDYCERRMRSFSFAEGFDIVRKGGGTKANPSWRFRCLFHGEETRNDRKLEDKVERDEHGTITSRNAGLGGGSRSGQRRSDKAAW
jgi:hypothetical protein